MRAFWHSISRDRRGAAMMEMAAALPVLVLLLLGGVEVSRFAMLNQKLDRLATTMGDLVSQAETLSEAGLEKVFMAAEHFGKPFAVKTKAEIIISSVSVPAHDPSDPPPPWRIGWQHASTGGISVPSEIGAEGAAPNLPNSMKDMVAGGHTLIVSEVFFDFEPMFFGYLMSSHRIYHRAFFRPRKGALTSLN
jgi:Flp pilus assembly protein TadG